MREWLKIAGQDFILEVRPAASLSGPVAPDSLGLALGRRQVEQADPPLPGERPGPLRWTRVSQISPAGQGELIQFQMEGRQNRVEWQGLSGGGSVGIRLGAECLTVDILDPAEAGAEHIIRSTMPGKIVSLPVKDGDNIAAGQTVILIEAMKMENPVAVHRDGVVAKVLVEPGQIVGSDEPLLELEPEGV